MPDNDYFTWTKDLFSKDKINEKPETLKGVRVIELATRIYGPATADYLAEFGAEVIKVELPLIGDLMRYVTPQGFFWKNASPAFFPQNRNKFHIAVDVRKPEGKEIFKKLTEKADIVVENLRAGTMDEWGIGYNQLKEINPKIIYAANSGFGQWGEYSEGRASYDATAQAVSGMSSITGFPERSPLKIGTWIGDFTGSLMSAISIVTALYHRKKTGEGQFIDLAQAEVLIRCLDWTWLYCSLTGKNRERAGNADISVSPSGIFRCKDGFAAISAKDDDEFKALSKALGFEELPEESRFKTVGDRLSPDSASELVKIISKAVLNKSVAEIEQCASKYGFSAGRVRNAHDHYNDEHLIERGSVWKVEDEMYCNVVEYGPVPKLSGSPGRLKWCAKPVGWHNEYVLTGLLNYTEVEIKRFYEQKVVGRWDDKPGAMPPEEVKNKLLKDT